MLRGAEMDDVIFVGTAARPGLEGTEVGLKPNAKAVLFWLGVG
jgi:chromosome segregation ATPase